MVDDISKQDEAFIRTLEESPEQRRVRLFGAIPPQSHRRFLPMRRVAAGGMSVMVTLAGGQGNPVSAGPINFTVTFSQAATGFANADVSFTGSTVGGTPAAAVTGTGPAYNVAVTGMTGNGNVTITIPAGSATATANGIAFPASNSATVVLDTTAPTVTINKAVGQADPTSTSPITYTVAFSESVIGFLASDIVFTGTTAGGTLSASLSGSGSAYSVEVTGMTTAGNVVASIPAASYTDLAGNSGGASSSTDNIVAWTPDTTAPTVTINKAASQADPASGASPILFDVVFSESVTGFATGDISFTGTTAGGTLVGNVSGSGTTYAVSVSGMSSDGNVVATVPAGVATDAASNLNLVSSSTDNSVMWTVVPIPPGTPGELQFNDAVNSGFTIVFNEPL